MRNSQGIIDDGDSEPLLSRHLYLLPPWSLSMSGEARLCLRPRWNSSILPTE